MPPLLVRQYAYLDAETQCHSDVLLCIISYLKKVGLLGSKITVLDYEKSGTRSGLEAVERLTVQSKKLKVCMWIRTVHAHIRIHSSITQLSTLTCIFMYLLTMDPELLAVAPSGFLATTLTLLASYWSYSLLLAELL